MNNDLKSQRIRLIENNISAFLANWKELAGALFLHDTIRVQIITGLPFAFLNSIANANFSGSDITKQITVVLTPFKTKKLPILWWIGPNSKPDNLDAYLESFDFKKTDEPPGMFMDLNRLDFSYETPPELRVNLVQNAKHVEEWVSVFIEGVGGTEKHRKHLFQSEMFLLQKNNYLRFIGYWEGEPVATSGLILNEDVAGLYFVITKPDYRGKGIGTAISRAALENAYKRGYHKAVLQSSKMGYNIYKRIGFDEYCKFKWYYYKFE
ncbi:MAG: GNAT family N-acetyltransferase [Candidatus Heimdallarchaeota archaeon]|nr:GNAT family N-acetyltransferase [Candidatus Heimdallarchaeota archaeon]MCK4877893.1 GNAT family N-acetyltransferase [Candidatus Heimdallarchaeota archaeon]